MVTRLYFHNTASSVVGTLPATEQSTKTSHGNFEAQTNNRTMNTTIGTAQVTKTFNLAENVASGGEWFFVTKFVSEPLSQSGLASNTWTYNFACKNSNNDPTDDYPTYPTPSTDVPMCCYVWRPSTGAKVGNIRDGDAQGFYDVGFDAHNDENIEKSEHGTFSGSAVAGTTTGDVIVFEAWINTSTSSSVATVMSYMFDGTTATLADGTTVSNHASFIETPENLTFVSSSPITMTQAAAKTYANKFIQKV